MTLVQFSRERPREHPSSGEQAAGGSRASPSFEEWLALGDELPMPRSRDLVFDLVAHVAPSLNWDHAKRRAARSGDRRGKAA